MNTRRQTIWLVSMLSLMVVLSAYYLFTDNVGEMETTSNTADQQLALDEVVTGEHTDEVELQDGVLEKAADTNMLDEISETDDQVLQKVESGVSNSREYFDNLIMNRNDALSKETEQLFNITLDPKQSKEAMVEAENKLQSIEETQAKVSDLEDELMREYENVVITEDSGKWKVVVQAETLEKSQVVTIMDMVINNLEIPTSKIAVQLVQ